MRPLLLAVFLTLVPASLHAQTLTVRDIVGLTKAGLGEDVLIALVEVHRSIFPVDPETLKMLKDAGVPQKVIVAMVKSGRENPPPSVAEPIEDVEPSISPRASRSAPPPQVVVVDHPREEPRVVEVPVAVPAYGTTVWPTIPLWPTSNRLRHDFDGRRVEPVFWGFGGKLRPDAWQPSLRDVPGKRFLLPDGPQKK